MVRVVAPTPPQNEYAAAVTQSVRVGAYTSEVANQKFLVRCTTCEGCSAATPKNLKQ